MQHLWDRNKDNSHICLFLCGSIYSLMHRIFEGSHEPLFGRATQHIFLKPFTTVTLKQILSENHPGESRNVRYEIEDNFLRFWFRFFYKYVRYIEAGALGKLQEIIIRDYPTFNGRTLEEYFKCKFRESGEFTALGGYWNRKGEDEIDLIALDEIEKKAVVAEIKRNRQNIKMDVLMQKGIAIQKELKGYSVEYRGLDMEDM